MKYGLNKKKDLRFLNVILFENTFKKRFIREAGIGRKYQHKNIADCLDIVDDGQHLALIMSYIEN